MPPMPELTRLRYPERPDCWHVFYGDVQVRTVARRVGNPPGSDEGEGMCGFYPGSRPAEYVNGTAADFAARRAHRDWTVQKYAMWETGERLPSQKSSPW